MYLYTGPAPRIFLSYKDRTADTTLYAEPGNVYDIAPVAGAVMPPENFALVADMPHEDTDQDDHTDSDGE
jgi:hypothetical protein